MKTIITLTFFVFCLNLVAEKRYIWLHGLMGNSEQNTWDIYNSLYTSGAGKILKYRSDRSIVEIANKIYEEEIKPYENEVEFVIIGHSMGGLVARYLQLITPSIKGLVTVGTGHMGATLLQSAFDGRITEIFNKTVLMSNNAIENSTQKNLVASFPLSVLAAPLVYPVLSYKNQVLTEGLQFINNQVSTAIYSIPNLSPCVRDLQPKSEFLNFINSKPIKVPFVNIYGAEDYYQFLRAMGSLYKSEEVKNSENIDREYDTELFDELNLALAVINKIQNAHDLVYKALAYPAVFMPWIWVSREMVLKAKLDWKNIFNYLQTGIHDELLNAMGSFEYRLTTYCLGNYKSADLNTCFTRFVPFQIENDGVLTRKDILIPNPENEKIYNVRVPKVNHMEMGNQPEMRKVFNALTNVGTYGKVFVFGNYHAYCYPSNVN